ncbi:GntR family transcriptional regulator [Ancrocorticia populi]|uniref:GntR family transcriptional regulator n=1 Tax=Ancrocorticia populi TaxID=2175228 RepID=UPI003F992E97
MASSARLADDLAAHLRDRILAGGLAPNAQLAEQSLAAEYDVARPTVRTAIAILERDGLLYRQPHMPATVARIEATELPDIIELLEVTENLALTHVLTEDPDLRPLRHTIEGSPHAFLDAFVELSGAERLSLIHRRSTFEFLLATSHDMPARVDVDSPETLQGFLNAVLLQNGSGAHTKLTSIQMQRRQACNERLNEFASRSSD